MPLKVATFAQHSFATHQGSARTPIYDLNKLSLIKPLPFLVEPLPISDQVGLAERHSYVMTGYPSNPIKNILIYFDFI